MQKLTDSFGSFFNNKNNNMHIRSVYYTYTYVGFYYLFIGTYICSIESAVGGETSLWYPEIYFLETVY